jgi:transposase
MIDVESISHIYMAQGVTDLRKGIDGYAALVSGVMKLDPFSSSMFLFCNRTKDKLKILVWDGNGFWLCYKRLESGKFKWLKSNSENPTYSLSKQQLSWLLEGLSVHQKKAFKPLENKVI